MADLYIYHHMGLGDMIHMNGMVRKLLADGDYESVFVFSKNPFKEMVEWMYRDNPKIKIIGVDEKDERVLRGDEKHVIAEILQERADATQDIYLSVGHEKYRDYSNDIGPVPCDIIFYELIGMPYSERFDSCYWERDMEEEERVYKKLTPEGEDYIFVHDDPSRTELVGGYAITNEEVGTKFKIVRNDISESIFHFGKLLENAKEIHVMESSFRGMMEFLKPGFVKNKVKLFMHTFRGGPYYNKELDIWQGTHLPWIAVGEDPRLENSNEN